MDRLHRSALRRVLLFCLLLFLSAGCGQTRNAIDDSDGAPPVVSRLAETPEAEFILEEAEQEFVARLRRRGGLRVAISNEQTMYEEHADGTITGLHYEMVRHLAELLDLEVAYTPVFFHQFFEKDGEFPQRVKTDPDFTYTPDLLHEVDFYAGTFSPLAWRKKFLAFVPVYHTRLIFISRRGEEIKQVEDLHNKRVALIANTSYNAWFDELDEIVPAGVEYLDSITGLETIEMVAAGKADVTISDANLAIVQIQNYPNLNVTVASEEIEQLCWATAKENISMRSILDKYFKFIKQNGTFERLWVEYYGISSLDYLDLIGYSEQNQ